MYFESNGYWATTIDALSVRQCRYQVKSTTIAKVIPARRRKCRRDAIMPGACTCKTGRREKTLSGFSLPVAPRTNVVACYYPTPMHVAIIYDELSRHILPLGFIG
jgi:hypothetical protein